MNWNKQIQKAWQQELTKGNYDTVGVLKFNRGTAIGNTTAETLYEAYWHKLDKVLFGSEAEKGVCVERWCFMERGKYGDNTHMHFVARAPFDTTLFCAVASALWVNFHRYTSAYGYSWITPIQCNDASSAYITKETWWLRDDMTGLKCSRPNSADKNYTKFDNPKQASRILNHIGIEELVRATEAVDRHVTKTTERRQLKQRLSKARSKQQA